MRLGGYSPTALLAALIGADSAIWQVAILRMAAWTAHGLSAPGTWTRGAGWDSACDWLLGHSWTSGRLLDLVSRPSYSSRHHARTGAAQDYGASAAAMLPGSDLAWRQLH